MRRYGISETGLARIANSLPEDNVDKFRNHIENTYSSLHDTEPSDRADIPQGRSFGEILCYELHLQPVNPRMESQTDNNGFCTGLTFKELAAKWGITVSFLGELIADHCRKLEEIPEK